MCFFFFFFEGLLARILETEDGLADKIGVMLLQFFDGGQVGETMMESFHESFVQFSNFWFCEDEILISKKPTRVSESFLRIFATLALWCFLWC